MVEPALKDKVRSGIRPAGHICHVCQEAILITDMLILVLSATWSVVLPELPQLGRQLKLHPECAQVYIRGWAEEKLHD